MTAVSTTNSFESGGNGRIDLEQVLPGETFPIADKNAQALQHSEPSFSDGPIINGRPTTLGLYEPHHLVDSPLLAQIRPLINAAFSASHARDGQNVMPAGVDRLQSEKQFLQDMGNDPGTFNYIVTYSGTDEVIATIGAHRYVAPVLEVVEGDEQRSAFTRVKAPLEAGEAEMWELKLMATDVKLQRQGLAGYMMALVDEEVKRRFRSGALANGERGKPKRLVIVLTTLKECNEAFYRRRGYDFDYETFHDKGFLGSETGFHVVHMSKVINV